MLICGQWLLCDDGVRRPIFRVEIESSTGSWIEAPFLVDMGADRTVFSAAIAAVLGLSPAQASHQLLGVGGISASILLSTTIRFATDSGTKIVFRGDFAAFTSLEALDMSVLGRDILNLFAVIVDRPQETVWLVLQRWLQQANSHKS